jgi:hypothetical protein
VIQATFTDTTTGQSATADIPSEHGPSLRSAVNEIRNTLGGRVEGAFSFKKEHSLTKAGSAMGRMAAALNLVIPEDDPDYE